ATARAFGSTHLPHEYHDSEKASFGIHFRHGRSRYSRNRPDHPDPAEAGEELRRRRCRRGISRGRIAHGAVLAHAIRLCAHPRKLVRPFWPTPNHFNLVARFGTRLFAAGICPKPGLVL